VTEGLPADGEGDDRPGSYRRVDVRIAGAAHQPPSFVEVQAQMDELLTFLATPHDPRYDLIKTALAHHRFAWIHPFRNGNGRTVRLFTYALLIRQGFLSGGQRILNPTAVFCSDRDEYYARLADADSLAPEALLRWCRYVLGGLLTELAKIDRLLDFEYLRGTILGPALKELGRRAVVGPQELIILTKALEHIPLQRSDIEPAVGPISPAQLTRVIADLRDRQYLLPLTDGGRKYVLGFSRNPLLREVLRQLDQNGFLPLKGEV
jgi:Fic family protein